MSGNGIRLFSKFVIDRKIALPEGNALSVETGGGVRTVWPTMEGESMVAAKVAMGIPTFVPAEIPVDTTQTGELSIVKNYAIQVGGRELNVTCLAVGNPHAVVIMDDPVEDFPLVEIGPHVQSHKLFPNRINFEIVNVLDRSRIRARIFERGAGETLSSGTGSTAAATAARSAAAATRTSSVRTYSPSVGSSSTTFGTCAIRRRSPSSVADTASWLPRTKM